MRKIVFWNVEHISQNSVAIAERAAERVRAVTQGLIQQHARRAGRAAHRRLTRSMTMFPRTARYQLTREELHEIAAYRLRADAEERADRLRHKFELASDLVHSAPYVFYCEVNATHQDQQSPLIGNAAAGGPTLCYAYYQRGVSRRFSHCPITAQWYQGNQVNANRVPKGTLIMGGNGPVRVCFWHAPSGNNGAIVAQVYQGLIQGCAGAAFVLLGDLNAQPADLVANGVPQANIVSPGGPTRISGRCLDYAVTNVPQFFAACRPLHNGLESQAIKQRTGSDHMVMILEMH